MDRILLCTLLTLFIAVNVFSTQAYAIPAFASKYQMTCSGCHNAWPQLNRMGRTFKELGYRMARNPGAKTKAFFDPGTFPIAGLFVARPYDKKDSGERKIRAIHEIEIFFAGTVGNKIAFYSEIEAEDETGFKPEFGPLVLAYELSEGASLQLTWSQANWADGYGFLGDHFRLTRSHVGVIDQTFGGVDGKLRSARQNVALTGRVQQRLFYNVGVSGKAGDAEGEDDLVVNGRIAFDVKPNLMLGGFLMDGEVAGLAYIRTGLDVQSDMNNTRIQAAFVIARDDIAGGGTSDNSAYSLQAYHVLKGSTGRPAWVPLVRLDVYEKNDGRDEYAELTLNLTHYLEENVKAYVEFWGQLDTPRGVSNDNRFTLQLLVGL